MGCLPDPDLWSWRSRLVHTPPFCMVSPLRSPHGCWIAGKTDLCDGLSGRTRKGAWHMAQKGCPSPPSEPILPAGGGKSCANPGYLPLTPSNSMIASWRRKGMHTCCRNTERTKGQRASSGESGEGLQPAYDFLLRSAEKPSTPAEYT